MSPFWAGWIALLAACLAVLMEEVWIRLVRKWEIKQVEKSYGLPSHVAHKSGTPTMGGVVFPLACIALLLWGGPMGRGSVPGIWGLPFGAFAVGFADDWLKFTKRSSEGLRSLEKLFLQVIVALGWSSYAVLVDELFIFPGIIVPPPFSIALLTFFAVGMMNAVNVTDGLDGLAAGASALSFLGLALLPSGESPGVSMAVSLGLGICVGFLWHNCHPASVFMGDGGSHFLGGLLFSLCIWKGGLFFMVPFGFLFGVELVSVAVQIIAIRGFKRKVFRMSPIHHHFELMGWPETKVVARFWLLHAAGMVCVVPMIFGILEVWR